MIRRELRLQPTAAKLRHYSATEWQRFCQQNNFNETSEGLYIPTAQTAYVRDDSPRLLPNILHELYGHGLFFAHSELGRDPPSPSTNLLGIAREQRSDAEGFALWTEALLCGALGIDDAWQDKYSSLPASHQSLYCAFQHAENVLTRRGFLAQLGFPRACTHDELVAICDKFIPNFNQVDLALIYGSQKPYSDIDVFLLHEKDIIYYNGWLDLYGIAHERFNHLLSRLDLSITDPLFSGTLIRGSHAQLFQLQQRIQKITITAAAIDHHERLAAAFQEYARRLPIGERHHRIAVGYAESYKANALALRDGQRPLTYAALKTLQ